ncbi:hypothetical protein F5884DRAFT_251671 [Xylogone sp. PMI_703]|nr:hypothetical protein F5884DRAFT_251671 [Xylogone sp. PMI_703]
MSASKGSSSRWALLTHSSLLKVFGFSILLFSISTTLRFLQYGLFSIVIAGIILLSALVRFAAKDVASDLQNRVCELLLWFIGEVLGYIRFVTLQKMRIQSAKH